MPAMPPFPHRRVQRMRGFVLIQLSILLAVLAILGVVAAQQFVNTLDERQAEAAGSYALAVKNALDEYLVENQFYLHNGVPVSGFANSLAPTLQELRTAKYLDSTFPLIDPMRKRYLVEVRRQDCPGPTCEINAIAYANTPLTQRCATFASDGACTSAAGDVKHRTVESIRGASQGFGAAVTRLAPSRYRGSVCDHAAPAAAAIGTYGVCTSDNAAIYAQFVRIGDHRDPNLAGNLTVAGHIRGESLQPTGTAVIGEACTAEETGTVRQTSGSTGNSPLAVCSGTVWISLASKKIANVEDVCTVDGESAETPAGEILICRNGRYYYFTSFFGKYLLVDSQYGNHNSVISKPVCDAKGEPYIVLVPGSESSSSASFFRYVNDNGSSWTVQLTDALGNALASAVVTAQIYCKY